MNFFNDDLFDEFVKGFFEGVPKRKSYGEVIEGESEERTIDYIEEGKNVYFVFELSGYSKEDLKIQVKGNELIIQANKRLSEGIQPYLSNKLSQGIYFKKRIPSNVRTKNFEHTFKNGILEVSFLKK